MIDSPDQLLAKLTADPVLMAWIGTYTFAEGTQAPAISILGASEFIDGLSEVEGVELVISRVPTTTSRALYSGCIQPEKEWTIHLIQYETGNDAMSAADYLIQLYPGASYSSLGAQSLPELAGVAQLAVKIPANVNL